MRLVRWIIVDLISMEKVDSFGNYTSAELALGDLEKKNPLGSYKITCKWGNL